MSVIVRRILRKARSFLLVVATSPSQLPSLFGKNFRASRFRIRFVRALVHGAWRRSRDAARYCRHNPKVFLRLVLRKTRTLLKVALTRPHDLRFIVLRRLKVSAAAANWNPSATRSIERDAARVRLRDELLRDLSKAITAERLGN